MTARAGHRLEQELAQLVGQGWQLATLERAQIGRAVDAREQWVGGVAGCIHGESEPAVNDVAGEIAHAIGAAVERPQDVQRFVFELAREATRNNFV